MLPGMTFTIEPILCLGEPKFKILSDDWTAATRDNSRAAQFEHTILVTTNGREILTYPDSHEKNAQKGKWENPCYAHTVNYLYGNL